MQIGKIRERINILQNVKIFIQSGELTITENLLTLLDKVGINLDGYKRTVPVKENIVPFEHEKNKQLVYKD